MVKYFQMLGDFGEFSMVLKDYQWFWSIMKNSQNLSSIISSFNMGIPD